MYKIVLCFTIILLCSLVGFLKASKYSERVKELEYYMNALRELAAEMNYRLTPLSDILGSMPVAFYRKTSEYLAQNMNMTQAWQAALEEQCRLSSSALTGSDKAIIAELGNGLGYTGIADQHSRFELTLTRLEKQLGEAKADASSRGAMYKKMGILMGITVAILII